MSGLQYDGDSRLDEKAKSKRVEEEGLDKMFVKENLLL